VILLDGSAGCIEHGIVLKAMERHRTSITARPTIRALSVSHHSPMPPTEAVFCVLLSMWRTVSAVPGGNYCMLDLACSQKWTPELGPSVKMDFRESARVG